MTLYRGTVDGPIAFTPEEEAELEEIQLAQAADRLRIWSQFQREVRNKLLAETDWMEFRGVLTDEWEEYRQGLRDVPAQEGFPADITWPTKPE